MMERAIDIRVFPSSRTKTEFPPTPYPTVSLPTSDTSLSEIDNHLFCGYWCFLYLVMCDMCYIWSAGGNMIYILRQPLLHQYKYSTKKTSEITLSLICCLTSCRRINQTLKAPHLQCTDFNTIASVNVVLLTSTPNN